MLNLSDNELDRLSREAASQHDLGDPLGPQSWERLELRLDKELGRAGPDVSRGVRGIRRLPFQYAPVLLLVVGVTYYFAKVKGRKAESSGSPPLTVVKTPQQQPGTDSISSLKNPAYSDKSTSTLYPGGDSLSGTATGTPTAPASSPAGLEPSSAGPNSTSAGLTKGSPADHTAPVPGNGIPGRDNGSPGSGNGSTASGNASPGSGNGSTGSDIGTSGPDKTAPVLVNSSKTDRSSHGLANNSTDRTVSHNDRTAPHNDHTTSGPVNTASALANGSGTDRPRSGQALASSGLTTHGSHGHSGNGRTSGKDNKYQGTAGHQTTTGQSPGQHTAGNETAMKNGTGRQTQAPDGPPDPERAFVQHPVSLRSHPRINDSALRAYVAQMPKDADKNPGRSNHILRHYTIGLQFAPDFSSVNALAGDKPGSSLGLTFDFNFLDKWHLGTGLLFSRKNYTARGRDYHVPMDYYRQNGMKPVDFVKGTMNMLEIPLNLRYDFSETGNTLFFATVGASSYLFGQENCNYYYDFFGGEACRKFYYSNTPNGLFSSVNLSLGVETGISNSVSVLIAPYMKLPTSDMGFGKVRMSSVGINFAIHFTPVSGRKRY